MIKTSDFVGMLKGQFDYLFFLVCSGYWYYSGSPLMSVVNDAFARRLGDRAALVTSFSEDVESIYERVMAKDWPDAIREQLDLPFSPIVLAIGDGPHRLDSLNIEISSNPAC